MRELANYWATQFDWRAQERALNALPQFTTRLGDVSIHFVHVKSSSRNAMPLLLTHGWPGTFCDFLKLIPLLRGQFDLVIPSMPGYAFSSALAIEESHPFVIAELWLALMDRLGYHAFGAHGGDWGASVSTALALKAPERVRGIHLNYIPGSYRPHLPAATELTPDERAFLVTKDEWWQAEGAYAHVHRTRPETLAFALEDSPVGAAAWIVEKLQRWSDCDGDVERRFTRDEILTTLSLFWLTRSMQTSVRIYAAVARRPLEFGEHDRVRVPCGVIRFAKEAPFPPRAWIERGYNVVRWSESPRGGHFAAMEEPEVLANDIRSFFEEH